MKNRDSSEGARTAAWVWVGAWFRYFGICRFRKKNVENPLWRLTDAYVAFPEPSMCRSLSGSVKLSELPLSFLASNGNFIHDSIPVQKRNWWAFSRRGERVLTKCEILLSEPSYPVNADGTWHANKCDFAGNFIQSVSRVWKFPRISLVQSKQALRRSTQAPSHNFRYKKLKLKHQTRLAT